MPKLKELNEHNLDVRRYRLLPRLKARMTNTPYEDIVISDKPGSVQQTSQSSRHSAA